MQCPNCEEANEDWSQRKANVENELLNQIGVEDDDAGQEAKQPQGCGNQMLKDRLRIQQVPPGLRTSSSPARAFAYSESFLRSEEHSLNSSHVESSYAVFC